MELFSNNKRYLVAAEVVAVMMLSICILSLRSEGEVTLISWQAVGLFISCIIFIIAFLPLCYLSWFSNADKTKYYYMKQTFFWLLAISFLFIFIGIGSMYFENS